MEEKICVKCSSSANHKKFNLFLCDVCYHFSPNKEEDYKRYINEKIDGKILDLLDKYNEGYEVFDGTPDGKDKIVNKIISLLTYNKII